MLQVVNGPFDGFLCTYFVGVFNVLLSPNLVCVQLKIEGRFKDDGKDFNNKKGDLF